MKFLLDTQCWLWMAGTPEKFSDSARRQIRDIRHELCLSPVVAMEIAIKYSVGKLPLHIPPAEFIPILLGYERVSLLMIEFRHAIRLASLPFHHRDPFDRILIAQAQVENLPVMTADARFERYDIEVIPAS